MDPRDHECLDRTSIAAASSLVQFAGRNPADPAISLEQWLEEAGLQNQHECTAKFRENQIVEPDQVELLGTECHRCVNDGSLGHQCW